MKHQSNKRERLNICMASDFFYPNMGGMIALICPYSLHFPSVSLRFPTLHFTSLHFTSLHFTSRAFILIRSRNAHLVSVAVSDPEGPQGHHRHTCIWEPNRHKIHVSS